MIFSSYKISRFNEYFKLFTFFVFFLLLILCTSFFLWKFFNILFFFEVSLIPTLLIIMGWGYQPERLQAGVYFLFYTLTASLPLLLFIIYRIMRNGTLSFFLGSFIDKGLGISSIFLMGLIGIMAFLVKLPMYFTHL